MKYPSIEPSSRTYTHGEWPVSRHKFMTGRSQQMLHANAKATQRLRLRYDNRSLEEFDQFLNHYDTVLGTTKGFKLPKITLFVGWSKRSGDDRRFGANVRWRYTKAPRIRSQRGGLGTIEIELQTVGVVDKEVDEVASGGSSGGGPDKPVSTGPKPPDGTPGSGDPGNGPAPEFPSGSGGGGAGWGDGAGSGPGGGGFGGGGGAWPGFPGSPAPTPPSCPPGQIYKNGQCVDIPELNDPQALFAVVYQSAQSVLYDISQYGTCLRDETGCDGPWFIDPGCSQEMTRYGKWPITLVKYFDGEEIDTPQITNPPPPAGETPWGDFGCYSKSWGFSNYNYAATISMNPNYKSPIWEYVDAEGTVLSDPIRNTKQRVNGACEAATILKGDVREPNAEIVQIIQLGKGTIWQSANYVDPIDCQNWPDPPPTSRHYERSLEVKRQMNVLAGTRSSTTSNYFPNVSPSRRRIIFGDYEVDRYGSDQEVTMPLPSTAQKTDVVMQLVYANRHDEIARLFLDHYDQCSGEFYDFPIAGVNEREGTFAGWDDPDTRNIRRGRWIYTRPPQIEQTAINHSTTTIELLNLSPELMDPDAGSGSGSSDGTFGDGP